MRPTQTTPPDTPNPFTWRGFANVRMGDYLLGEDTVDLLSLGFCGDTVTVTCSTCGEVLGAIPVELYGEEFHDLTTYYISPALDWHDAKHHPRLAYLADAEAAFVPPPPKKTSKPNKTKTVTAIEEAKKSVARSTPAKKNAGRKKAA